MALYKYYILFIYLPTECCSWRSWGTVRPWVSSAASWGCARSGCHWGWASVDWSASAGSQSLWVSWTIHWVLSVESTSPTSQSSQSCYNSDWESEASSVARDSQCTVK